MQRKLLLVLCTTVLILAPTHDFVIFSESACSSGHGGENDRVLMIDADEQCSLTAFYIPTPANYTPSNPQGSSDESQ